MWGTECMRRKIDLIAGQCRIVLLTFGILGGCHCAAAESISDSEIARIVRELPTVDDATLREAARSIGSPPGVPSSGDRRVHTFRFEALPKPAASGETDLGKATKGVGADGSSVSSMRRAISSEPALLVFVSFSMPDASLRSLVSQAERARATLILRGPFKSSFKETVVAIQKLIGGRKVSFQLHPEAFDRFGVVTVPTFVLTSNAEANRTCKEEACGNQADFVRVTGDVTIEYALEFMLRNATSMRNELGAIVERMRGS